MDGAETETPAGTLLPSGSRSGDSAKRLTLTARNSILLVVIRRLNRTKTYQFRSGSIFATPSRSCRISAGSTTRLASIDGYMILIPTGSHPLTAVDTLGEPTDHRRNEQAIADHILSVMSLYRELLKGLLPGRQDYKSPLERPPAATAYEGSSRLCSPDSY